jgi:hypothetical protein
VVLSLGALLPVALAGAELAGAEVVSGAVVLEGLIAPVDGAEYLKMGPRGVVGSGDRLGVEGLGAWLDEPEIVPPPRPVEFATSAPRAESGRISAPTIATAAARRTASVSRWSLPTSQPR